MKRKALMKPRHLIRPGGILRWSTTLILAGGVAGLSSCDNSVKDVMDGSSGQVAEVDPVKKQLESGLVENNFHLPKVGYYHAAVNQFFPEPYNQYRDGKWFVDGEWRETAGVDRVAASRPAPDQLKKVEAALEEEQKAMAQNPQAPSGGGFGMGNALMMYWLLSGNRGFFSPGAGFQRATSQAPGWQRTMDDQRRRIGGTVSGSNNSYRTTPGTPDGGSTRGGFGSRTSGSSFGS